MKGNEGKLIGPQGQILGTITGGEYDPAGNVFINYGTLEGDAKMRGYPQYDGKATPAPAIYEALALVDGELTRLSAVTSQLVERLTPIIPETKEVATDELKGPKPPGTEIGCRIHDALLKLSDYRARIRWAGAAAAVDSFMSLVTQADEYKKQESKLHGVVTLTNTSEIGSLLDTFESELTETNETISELEREIGAVLGVQLPANEQSAVKSPAFGTSPLHGRLVSIAQQIDKLAVRLTGVIGRMEL